MDLPPDKAKLLKNYDDEKKWDIICDQVTVFTEQCEISLHSPSFVINFACYLNNLQPNIPRY